MAQHQPAPGKLLDGLGIGLTQQRGLPLEVLELFLFFLGQPLALFPFCLFRQEGGRGVVLRDCRSGRLLFGRRPRTPPRLLDHDDQQRDQRTHRADKHREERE